MSNDEDDNDSFGIFQGPPALSSATGHATVSLSATTPNVLTKHIHRITLNVPEDILKKIGEVTIKFAYIEAVIRHVLFWLSVGDKPAIGRIAVGDPRIDSSFIRIKQLLSVREKTINIDLDALEKELKECERNRDLIAHAIWLNHAITNELYVQKISGNWSSVSPKTSRREKPEAVRIDHAWLRDAITKINEGIRNADLLYKEIRSLPQP